MATSIPTSVAQDIKNMFTDMRRRASNLRVESALQAKFLDQQSWELESMYDAWLKRFPDTTIS